MSLQLPPLNAFRAFEAAARNGSYVIAAKELGVSAAAVSQQVKNLEGFLDKQLFIRLNNRVVLTDAGQAIFAGASEALQAISLLVEEAKTGQTRSRLAISVLPSVAHRWLAQRLAAFGAHEKNFRFELRVEDDPVDLAGSGIDLRLCYGAKLYPDLKTAQLRHDEVLPLASPDYLTRNPRAMLPDLAGVSDDDLIHTDWGPNFGSHPSWRAWFAKLGHVRPSAAKGHVVGTSGLALDLAGAGTGVALGQRMLAQHEIAAGRLVTLSEITLRLGHPYSLVWPPSSQRKKGLLTLVEWLVSDGRGGRHGP